MLEEFLKNYEEELQTSRMEKMEEVELLSTKHQETKKLLELIQSENEEIFTEFTPRSVTQKNADKIDELTESLQLIEDDKRNIEMELASIEKKLRDIKVAFSEISSNIIAPNEDEISTNVSRETSSSISISKDKLHLVLSYLPQDPIRAKLELEQFLK